jgi:hypothetical protein
MAATRRALGVGELELLVAAPPRKSTEKRSAVDLAR